MNNVWGEFMKKFLFFIFVLLIIPFKTYATNDVTINCNKTKLKFTIKNINKFKSRIIKTNFSFEILKTI